jgi:hypothetical protein
MLNLTHTRNSVLTRRRSIIVDRLHERAPKRIDVLTVDGDDLETVTFKCLSYIKPTEVL